MEEQTVELLKVILLLIILDIIPSIGDISTDIVNSLDMLVHNASDAKLFNSTGLIDPEEFEPHRTDQIWGIVGMCILFAPGIIAFVYTMLSAIEGDDDDNEDDNCFDKAFSKKSLLCKRGRWSFWAWGGIFCLFLPICLCFPVAMIILQIYILVCQPMSKDWKETLMLFIAFEAFFESAPQLHLQIFTLIYGYQVTYIQVFSILFSFVLLAKTAIMFDLSRNSEFEGKNWKQKIKVIFSLLPVYVTSIAFKIPSTTLQMAFFRGWSTIPLTLQVLESAAVAMAIRISANNMFLLVSSNMIVMNGGMAICDDDIKFVKWSSAITYLHSSITLIILAVLVNTNPTLLPHWTSLRLNGINLIIAVVVFIVIGAVNLGFQQMWDRCMTRLEGNKDASGVSNSKSDETLESNV